jgi:hypothetical protein
MSDSRTILIVVAGILVGAVLVLGAWRELRRVKSSEVSARLWLRRADFGVRAAFGLSLDLLAAFLGVERAFWSVAAAPAWTPVSGIVIIAVFLISGAVALAFLAARRLRAWRP